MTKSRKIILALVLFLVGIIVFPLIRGPVDCPYGGALTMTGSDCHCLGFWQETGTYTGGLDEGHDGMCIGYRL